MPGAAADYSAAQLPARLVAAAQALYQEQGIEAVSAADLARYVRLPVRTVEEALPASKAALVEAVLKTYHDYMTQSLTQKSEAYSSAVEELLALRQFIEQEMSQVRNLFFRDLQTYYPASWQYWLDKRATTLLTYFRGNLTRGIAQQLYQPGLEVEEWAQRWLAQVADLPTAATASEESAAIHSSLLTQLLADITTPAGAFVVRRLQEAPPYY